MQPRAGWTAGAQRVEGVGTWREVPAAELRAAAADFLELYGDRSVLGESVGALLGDGDGEERLDRLLAATGHDGDPDGFFSALESLLRGGARSTPVVGGVEVPGLLIQALLEHWLPGQDVVDVRSVARLERLMGSSVPPADHEAVRQVLDRYPVRLTMHTVRQARLSPAVSWQYLPFVEELDPDGLVHTWVGRFHHGVAERMYRNRMIFVLNMTCPVYCRFCFRKHKECRSERPPTRRDVLDAVAYVRTQPEVREVVLTGGDPFMNRATLTCAVDGLAQVEHVETLRLATRSLSYHPSLFTAREGFWLEYLKRKQSELWRRGKRLEIATHFIHPDELSVASLELIAELARAGITVYVQTPLLGGCNDDAAALAELFERLRAAGAEMHYVFMPCSPLQGNGRYRTSISDGLEVAADLRSRLSDRAIPKFCTATAIGKIEWETSGWAVERDTNDPRFLWIRTPYTPDYFAAFAADPADPGQVRQNAEGTLDARFLVDVGNDRWLRRSTGGQRPGHPRRTEPEPRLSARARATLRTELEREPGGWGRPDPAVKGVTRGHPTRVELDLDLDEAGRVSALEAISRSAAIREVVLFGRRDPVRRLKAVQAVCERLSRCTHVMAVRLRCRSLVETPGAFTDPVVRRLGELNRPGVVRPLRVEVETVVLHPSELGRDTVEAVRRLRRRGVTVTASFPLLVGVNDHASTLMDLLGRCRRAGVEVHQAVIGGLPVQRRWGRRHPVRMTAVIDLASETRRSGSGRELPRWVLWTPLGDVDFGIGAETVETDGRSRTAFRLRSFASAEGEAPLVWIEGVLPG